jgi:V8-like Glu-specific endopeptidase
MKRTSSPLRALARALSPSLSILGMLLALAACGPDGSGLPGALSRPIVNGTLSADGYLPAVGALVVPMGLHYEEYCSGTLIGDTLVLTAGHCVTGIPAGYKTYFFIGNDVRQMNASDQLISVTKAIPHPSFKDDNAPSSLSDWYDIAVLKLSKAPTGITPMKMPKPSQVSAIFQQGQSVLAMGFGMTDPNDQSSNGVKYQGSSQIYEIASSEFWIYDQNGAQKCSGDSGGPTLVNTGSTSTVEYRVIGVASRAGEGCVDGSVETRVDAYLTWLHQQGTIPCGSGLSADCTTQPKAALGQACKVAADCTSTFCVTYEKKLACSQTCSLAKKDCPSGYTCVSTGSSSSPACVKSSWVPAPKKSLGEACTAASECTSGICGSFDGASSCTQACTVVDDCSLSDTLTCRAADDGSSRCGPPQEAAPATDGASGGCGMAASDGAGRRGRDPLPPLLFPIGLALLLRARRRAP